MNKSEPDVPLEQALRNLVGGRAETGLVGLRHLREHVDRLLGQVEEQLVGRALASGSTLEEVGRSLDISKSAAHRRYGHLLPPGRRGQTRLWPPQR